MKNAIILLLIILISFTFSQAFANLHIIEEPTPDRPDIIKEPTPKISGSGCNDCTPPTISYDRYGIKRVDNGFCINDICVDGGLYHTDYPMQSTLLYFPNTISLKYYENNGPSNIKLVQLGIGVPEDGSPISKSQALIEVWLNNFSNDIYNPTIKEIKIIDPEGLLYFTKVTIELVPCMLESNSSCLQTNFSYSYTKVPDSGILVTNAVDWKRNAINNYIIEGLTVIWY